MKILLVYAYPNKSGFNHTIRETVEQNIKKSHEIKTIDLYNDKFNPVLFFDQQQKRRFLYLDKETDTYRSNILWSDLIIFIFPIWWSSMPAILKGFIDRVFAKDFAYKYKGIFPIGLLKQKKAWIINTHDSPMLYAKFFQKDYGKILNRQILKMCGIKTQRHDSLSFVRGSTQKKRVLFLNKIKKISSKI